MSSNFFSTDPGARSPASPTGSRRDTPPHRELEGLSLSAGATPKPKLNPAAITRHSTDCHPDDDNDIVSALGGGRPSGPRRSEDDSAPSTPNQGTGMKPTPPQVGRLLSGGASMAGLAGASSTPKKSGGVFSSLKMIAARNSSKERAQAALATSLDRSDRVPLNREYPSLHDFEVLRTIGTGGFGRVKLVRHKATNSYFALKILCKQQIIHAKQVQHVMSERNTLEKLQHPFVIRLHSTYQDRRYIYMLMEYVAGGDFFSHLRAQSRFPTATARHYVASIVVALEYVHAQGVAYRDLKPENLLIDHKGVLKMTDFGLCKQVKDGERTWTVCGTPEYLAPEIILTKGHGRAVDWWALGVLIFEFIAGYPPFYDENPYKIYEKVLIGKLDFPRGFDEDAMDLVRHLLKGDLTKRFGNLKDGARDIMLHKFFRGVDWVALANGQISPPIVPMVSHDGDTRNFDEFSEEENQAEEMPASDTSFKGF